MVSIINKSDTGSPDLNRHLESVHAVNWSATSLGPIESWPPDITQLLHVMMVETHPRMLLLGHEQLMIYNDAHATLLGADHPKTLGVPFKMGWKGRLPARDFDAIDEAFHSDSIPCTLTDCRLSIVRNGDPLEISLDWTVIPLLGHARGLYVSLCERPSIQSTRPAQRPRYVGSEESNGTSITHNKIDSEVILTPSADANAPWRAQHSVETDAGIMPSDDFSDGTDMTTHNGRLLDLMDLAECGVFAFNTEGQLLEANEAWSRQSGHPLPGPGSKEHTLTFMDYVYPKDADVVLGSWNKLAEGKPVTFEMRWKADITPQTPNGYLWILAACVPHMKDGVLQRVMGCTIAIAPDNQKTAEAFAGLDTTTRLRHTDELVELRKVIVSANVGIVESLVDGTYLWANDAFYRLSGIVKGSSESFEDSVHATSVDRVARSWNILRAGNSDHYEICFKAPINEHGEDFQWCLVSSQPVFDDDGNVRSVFCCLSDISTRKRTENERRQIQNTLYKLTENCQMGILMADRDWNVTYNNSKLTDVLGIPGAKLTDIDSWMASILEEDHALVMSDLPKILTGETMHCEFRSKKPWKTIDGIAYPTWIAATTTPELDHSGVIQNIIVSLFDISSLKWAEHSQRIRLEEVIEAKRQQENFIDMTSHEIRNPLGAVVHCADSIMESLQAIDKIVLELEHTNDKSSIMRLKDCITSGLDSVQTISSCTSHQKRIVDDILVLSKLDSNLLQISPICCRISDILGGLEALFAVEAQRELVNFRTEADPSLETDQTHWLLLDHGRINQILINLITNAIKFIKNRSVRNVTVRMGKSATKPTENSFQVPVDFALVQSTHDTIYDTSIFSEKELYLWFTVEDSGIGMTPDERSRIFSRFAQGSPRTYGKYGGSGLGLFISTTLASLQGGEIGVASQAGVGSTFAFFVKTSPCNPEGANGCKPGDLLPAPTIVDAQPTGVPPNRVSVLVVEDNLLNQRVMKKQLSKTYDVHTADNGKEALDFLEQSQNTIGNEDRTQRADVILMDIEMPILNGLDATRRIRELETEGRLRGHVPIIAVSANARPEQMAQALASGMDDSISKPFRIPDLLPKIDRLVRWTDRAGDDLVCTRKVR